jgi:hypothetical protein
LALVKSEKKSPNLVTLLKGMIRKIREVPLTKNDGNLYLILTRFKLLFAGV